MANGGCHEKVHRWNPLQTFLAKGEGKEHGVALVILNQPLDSMKHVFQHLWSKAAVKIFVDGAVNRVASCFGEDLEEYVPDIVTGDFDSAQESLLDFYRRKGVDVCPTPDQDFTDFHKALLVLSKHITSHPQSKIDSIYVLGAFGGRLDHVLANVNVLYTLQASYPAAIFLMDEGNLTWLLNPGRHELAVKSGLEGEWCGLVPVGCPCESVTTSGLHWDLYASRMEMGGVISTSNRLARGEPDTVTVSCTHPLLWCMAVNVPPCDQ